MRKKHYHIEVLLGMGLGCGYLTSLRFLGPVGASELLVLYCIVALIGVHGRSLFLFGKGIEGQLKLYTFFSIFFMAPLMTFVTYFISGYSQASTPKYLVSFMMGWLLWFLLREALEKGFSLKNTTFWFAGMFIVSNIISIYFFPQSIEAVRYKGGAENPNQLLFYAWTLSLLLIVYHRKLAWVAFPCIIFIMLKTGSDAFNLSLVLVFVSYLVLKFLVWEKLPYNMSLITILLALLISLYAGIHLYGHDLQQLWLAADEGGARINLMWHALLVSLQSPLFGWGVGSFSGINHAFERAEAHNTFLDLSMQFGFLFAICIYGLTLMAWLRAIQRKDLLIAAFIIGFLLSGLFHFSGRHFVFWVELAIFMHYVGSKNRVPLYLKSTRSST